MNPSLSDLETWLLMVCLFFVFCWGFDAHRAQLWRTAANIMGILTCFSVTPTSLTSSCVGLVAMLFVFSRGPAVILDKKYVVVVWKRGCVEC